MSTLQLLRQIPDNTLANMIIQDRQSFNILISWILTLELQLYQENKWKTTNLA